MIALLFLKPICKGFLISLLAYLPPLNSMGRSTTTMRLLLAFSLGLASFFILYGSQTYHTAYVAYHMGEMRYECQSCDHRIYVPPEFSQEELEYEKAIIIEYWAREILPPVFQSTCNTEHPTVCRLADDISARNANEYISSENADQIHWNEFLHYFASSFNATISTLLFVHLFTRRKDVHRRIPLF